MANFIVEFLDSNDVHVLYDRQFGFRKAHSTSHAIITLVEKISKSLDTGKVVVGVFLDLKKAFDTVDHEILLQKLDMYGIKNNLLQWFKSYLSNRTQYVCLNYSKSDIRTISYGIPQGSILGPLLFIIYVNDFSRASKLLFSILFADDTSVFIEGHTYNDTIRMLNNELEHIFIWLSSNKLTLNIEKTHYMVFHRAKIKDRLSINVRMQGRPVNEAKSIKFLGVIIDNKLNWNEHIIYIKNKISKSIGIIYKTRKFVDKKTLVNMYYTFVFPYFIYCSEIWGNACHVHLEPLILLQKRIVRIMTYSHYIAHTEPLFKQLEILNFRKLVIHRIALMMFKHSMHVLPAPLDDLFELNSNIHDYNTRTNNALHTLVGGSEKTYANFSFHGVHIWNIISQHINTNVSYACFKHLSKNYIICHDMKYRIRT